YHESPNTCATARTLLCRATRRPGCSNRSAIQRGIQWHHAPKFSASEHGQADTRRAVIDHARALRVGSGDVARDMGADHLAAAATQRVVLERRTRLAGLAPATKRTDRAGSGPVAGELVDARPPIALRGRWCREAARGEPAVGLRP